MSTLELAVVGNCQTASLIDPVGRVVWSCHPSFDGDPVFCALLGGLDDPPAGFMDVELVNHATSDQSYRPNTPILETRLQDAEGNVLEVIDFAPRFLLFGRSFRPAMHIRRISPVRGSPVVRLRVRPMAEHGAIRPAGSRGSNHIRWATAGSALRLTTDASLSAILEEQAFRLERPLTLVLGPDESVEESPDELGRRFLDSTTDYWQRWTRGLHIPFEWQEAVIRAAITLKLCTFEDTGAVVAALTTSVPEAPDTVRNWDYRFCWLRDAYFVVKGLNQLGATKTMESYLRFIMDRVAVGDGNGIQPVYRITGSADLEERVEPHLAGYRGMGPVRIGNQAYAQTQNDVYGAVILASMQSFFDRRLVHASGLEEFRRLEVLGERARQRFDQPDAGPWEYRGRAQVHTFSAVMCWAAADRLARIAAHLEQQERSEYWRIQADAMHAEIVRRSWNEELGAFTESFEGSALDASLLLLHDLRFLDADDPRFASTVDTIGSHLRRGDYVFRYGAEDDFGAPTTAFTICTFWYIGALDALGRHAEARALFERMLSRRNRLGLLSEDLDVESGELWGNFPQTYSMVGIIDQAMRLSRSWEDAL